MTSLAIVPAAGRSERFGSPKLTAPLRGEPLLAQTLRALLEGHVARVVVVSSETGVFDHIPLVADPRVSVVVNPDPDRGMFSSIQTGWASAEGDPVLILPGDMPFVRPATVAAVIAAYRRRPGFVVAQRHARHGHPIALPGSLRDAALAAAATFTLDAFIKSQALAPIEVEVDDMGILHDVDTPADLQR
jgi:molybdenum cofactor cytidylyltransferase